MAFGVKLKAVRLVGTKPGPTPSVRRSFLEISISPTYTVRTTVCAPINPCVRQ